MEDQYYISLADSFCSAMDDFAIEVTKMAEAPFSTDQPNNDKQERERIVSVRKNQMPTFDVNEYVPDGGSSKDTSEQHQQHNNKKNGKWQKLRSSVQRKMLEIQEEKKHISKTLLEVRRSNNARVDSSSTDRPRHATPCLSISRPSANFNDDGSFPNQFQQVLIVKSNSTCSTSTEHSELGDGESRQDSVDEQQCHESNDDGIQSDCKSHIEELAPIEEEDRQERPTDDDVDDLILSSSGSENNPVASDNVTSPQRQRKFMGGGLRAKLEDTQKSLEAANKEKNVLKGQLDAVVFKLGKLRKVIQQRSMENSRLNSILGDKNTVIETKNRELGVITLALKNSQDRNKKLEKEVELLQQQLTAEHIKTRGLQSKLDIVTRAATPSAVCTMTERASSSACPSGAFASSGVSVTSKPSPAESVASKLKERRRFFGNSQNTSDAKQFKSSYLKLSNSDEDKNKNDEGDNITFEESTTHEESFEDNLPPTEQSMISTMAKKFNSKPIVAQEDSRPLRDELEQIRHNLQGKCKRTKSSLESQWLSKRSAKKNDDEGGGSVVMTVEPIQSIQPPLSTMPGHDGAFENFFSPLKARIDLLEASCTESSRIGDCAD